MKTYKQILSLILAILMLAGLTACSRGTVTGDNSAWVNVWDFSTSSAISENGYYYSVNGSIWFADLQSGTTIPLCSKASCKHDGDSICEVNIDLINPVFFGGDSLYSIEIADFGTVLNRRDATGMGLMQVAKLGTKYTENEKVLTIKYFGYADGYLYYSAEVAGMVRNEETGVNEYVDEVQYISRVDLKTGKETYIIEDEVGAFYDEMVILAVQKDSVLFTHKNASDVRKEVENYRDILATDPLLVKCWNAGTGKITTVLETTYGDFTQEIGVDGGKIYHTSSVKKDDGTKRTATSVYDLDTGKGKILYEGTSFYLGGRYALRTVSGTQEQYFHDLETGKELPVALSDGYARVQIISDKGAVIYFIMDTKPQELRYYFVTREAMADGLQDEDLLYLYTKKNSV